MCKTTVGKRVIFWKTWKTVVNGRHPNIGKLYASCSRAAITERCILHNNKTMHVHNSLGYDRSEFDDKHSEENPTTTYYYYFPMEKTPVQQVYLKIYVKHNFTTRRPPIVKTISYCSIFITLLRYLIICLVNMSLILV